MSDVEIPRQAVHLTKLTVRHFKRLEEVEVDLGPLTVLCGPNNSGKTSALQSIMLWQTGLAGWLAKRGVDTKASGRPGVAINRRDLIALPVPATDLLWTGRRVRESGKDTSNIRIEIIAEGVTGALAWKCGLEFDYPNSESIYCRPMRLEGGARPPRMPVPEQARYIQASILPPMSGLAAVEPKWESGRIEVLIGEGQTAQILRNLCFQLSLVPDTWARLVADIADLFSVILVAPEHVAARGEVTMRYRDERGTVLDLSSAGRGLQQTLMLLAWVYTHPNTILLLDEPDAHLEILRQRQIYGLISKIARDQGCQIIIATHSEIILDEAREDIVVAFLSKPRRLDSRHIDLKNWLGSYPIDHVYQAEINRWILYLEGPTDLRILRAFADRLQHRARTALARPFVQYIGNDFREIQRHYQALRTALPGILATGAVDHTPDRGLPNQMIEHVHMWRRREIESYVARPEVLIAWASREAETGLPLIDISRSAVHAETMRAAILDVEAAFRTLQREIWAPDVKTSDEVLKPILSKYFQKLDRPISLSKSNYYELVQFIPEADIDTEVIQVLDTIADIAEQAAKPTTHT